MSDVGDRRNGRQIPTGRAWPQPIPPRPAARDVTDLDPKGGGSLPAPQTRRHAISRGAAARFSAKNGGGLWRTSEQTMLPRQRFFPPSSPALPTMAHTDRLDAPAGFQLARIESLPFGENSYVLSAGDGPDCVIIDPGFEPEAIIRWVESRGLSPAAILVTHGHSDHIAGNAALRRRWPGLPIIIGRGDAHKLTDPTANLSALFGQALVSPPADRLLDDGEAFTAGGIRFVSREIPGHSSGHVVFVLEGCDPPAVFGGDVLFEGGIGRTDFPDGDFDALAQGIRRHLYTLADETTVFPGHGGPTTVGRERLHNPFVNDAVPQD